MKKTLLAGAIALSLLGGCVSTDTSNEVPNNPVVNTAALETNSKPLVSSNTLTTADAQILKTQLLNLKDGDTLDIAPGKFANLGKIDITANNVTIKATEPGKTWLTGAVQINLRGNNIILDGVVFTEGGPAERMGGIVFRGNDNLVTNTTFYFFNDGYEYEPMGDRDEYPKYLWVSLYGKNNQLINNTFEGKHKRGTLIGVQKAKGDKTPDNHVIKGNLFFNQKSNQHYEFDFKAAERYNSNSWEAIRVGDSKSSIYPSKTLVEGNLFLQCDGETELITFKSGENVLRGNTIVDSASMISLRHGKNNTVENNVIIGNAKRYTGGIRFYDEGHVIRNNYIERVMGTGNVRGGIAVNTGITDVKNGEKLGGGVKGKGLNKQATPYKVLVENNSIIDSRQNILYSSKVHSVSQYDNSKVSTVYAGTDITFRNNLSFAELKKTLAVKGDDGNAPLVNPTYENELYYGEVAETTLPTTPGIITDVKPELVRGENGLLEATNYSGGARGLTVLTVNDTGATYRIQK
jgi:poly(beta-D-mannuronate) lyase